MEETRRSWVSDSFVLLENMAGLFLFSVAALTFVSAFFRYLLNSPIPDSYEISRQLIGITMCWGIASASYYGEHIYLDLLWTAVTPRWKRIIDALGTLISLFAMAVFAWMLFVKVVDGYHTQSSSVDLSLPIWTFHAVGWLGVAAAVLALAVRSVRLVGDALKGNNSFDEGGAPEKYVG
jgi:TRAP-type C4-dicarboxylate transport system permease small subunit